MENSFSDNRSKKTVRSKKNNERELLLDPFKTYWVAYQPLTKFFLDQNIFLSPFYTSRIIYEQPCRLYQLYFSDKETIKIALRVQ